MATLTSEEVLLLREIEDNKYANGPFAGMIFNAYVQHPGSNIDELIKSALAVRIRMKQLSKGE